MIMSVYVATNIIEHSGEPGEGTQAENEIVISLKALRILDAIGFDWNVCSLIPEIME